MAGGGPFLPYSLLGPMDRERRARAYADASIGMETGALWTTGVERTARRRVGRVGRLFDDHRGPGGSLSHGSEPRDTVD